MSTYAFILGKDPDLSLSELHAVFPQALFHDFSGDFVLMDASKRLDQSTFNRLGGSIKLAVIEELVSKKKLEQTVLEVLLSDHESGKLQYGVSVYGMHQALLRRLLLSLKKHLKAAGVSSRFANQNFKNLSVAQKKGLKGPEILVLESGGQFHVGRVIATQDIDAYSKRDYRKPFRSMKVGMLPPKLAQILVNLTGSRGPIWDPFCGGGVLVMEGLLSGHDMLGSDINQKTLVGAQKNVDWIRSEFQLSSTAELFVHDATQPFPSKKSEAIAFEGYLGPPQTRLKSESELQPVMSELNALYVQFFSQLRNAQFKGPIVAALPFFRLQGGKEGGLSCIEDIQKMGFQLQSLLSHRKCFSLKYARRDQWVGREIFKFKLD